MCRVIQSASVILHWSLDNAHKAGQDSPDIKICAEDVRRLILLTADALICSAPHVYISALLWSPTKSWISRTLAPKFNHRSLILSGKDDDWPAEIWVKNLSSRITCIMISPGGQRIACGCRDGSIWMLDSRTGQPEFLDPLRGHSDTVICIEFLDEDRLVSGSCDSTVCVWNLSAGTKAQAICVLEGDEFNIGEVWSIAYSPDGLYVAVGRTLDVHHDVNGTTAYIWTLSLWNASSGAMLAVHNENWDCVIGEDPGAQVVFSPDSKWVMTWSLGHGTKTLRRLKAGHEEDFSKQEEPVLFISRNDICPPLISPSGAFISYVTEEGILHIRNTLSGKETGQLALAGVGSKYSHITLLYCPDRQHVICSTRLLSGGFVTHVYNLCTNQTFIVDLPKGAIEALTQNRGAYLPDPDSEYIIYESRSNSSRVHRLTASHASPSLAPSVEQQIDPGLGDEYAGPWCWPITCATFSADCLSLVCGYTSGSTHAQVQLWDMSTNGSKLIPEHEWSFDVAPTGTVPMISRDEWGHALKFSPAAKRLKDLGSEPSWVQALAFSSTGERVACSFSDGSIHLLDVRTGSESMLERQVDGVPRSLAFSHDGVYLIYDEWTRRSRERTICQNLDTHEIVKIEKIHPSILHMLQRYNQTDVDKKDPVVYLYDMNTGQIICGSRPLTSYYISHRSNNHKDHSIATTKLGPLQLSRFAAPRYEGPEHLTFHIASVASTTLDSRDIQVAYFPLKETMIFTDFTFVPIYSRGGLHIASVIIKDPWNHRNSGVSYRLPTDRLALTLTIWDMTTSSERELCPPIRVDDNSQNCSNVIAAYFTSDNTQIITVKRNFCTYRWDLGYYISSPRPIPPYWRPLWISRYSKPGPEAYFGPDGQVQITERGAWCDCFSTVRRTGWGKIERPKPEGDIPLFWVPFRYREDLNDPRLIEIIELGKGPVFQGVTIDFEMLSKFVGTRWTDIYTET